MHDVVTIYGTVRLKTYPNCGGRIGGGTLNGYNLAPAGFSNNITSNSQDTTNYQTVKTKEKHKSNADTRSFHPQRSTRDWTWRAAVVPAALQLAHHTTTLPVLHDQRPEIPNDRRLSKTAPHTPATFSIWTPRRRDTARQRRLRNETLLFAANARRCSRSLSSVPNSRYLYAVAGGAMTVETDELFVGKRGSRYTWGKNARNE